MWHFTLLYNFPCEEEKTLFVLACLISVTLSPFFFSIFTQWLMDFIWRWTLSDTLFFFFFSAILFKNQIIWVKKHPPLLSCLLFKRLTVSACQLMCPSAASQPWWCHIYRCFLTSASCPTSLAASVIIRLQIPWLIADTLWCSFIYLQDELKEAEILKSDWHCKKTKTKKHSCVFHLPR